MQGQLTKKPLSVVIDTECAHCRQPIRIKMDSELNYVVQEPGAVPLVFTPMVDFQKLEDPSIIDGF